MIVHTIQIIKNKFSTKCCFLCCFILRTVCEKRPQLIRCSEVIDYINQCRIPVVSLFLQLCGMRRRNKARRVFTSVSLLMRSSSVTLPCSHSSTRPSGTLRTWTHRCRCVEVSTTLVFLCVGTESDEVDHTGKISLIWPRAHSDRGRRGEPERSRSCGSLRSWACETHAAKGYQLTEALIIDD